MNYSRANPSNRYQDLINLYRNLHEGGEPQSGLSAEKTFPGLSLLHHTKRIKQVIKATKAKNILDYGSGKGQQYTQNFVRPGFEDGSRTILDYWDVKNIDCYDPAYKPFSTLPTGKYEGVISTDMLEHCPEEDIPWVFDEIFGYAERFVYVNIACYPAEKNLPNGENAHITIYPKEWWIDLINKTSARYPDVIWETWIQYPILNEQGEKRIVEQKISNFKIATK